MSRPAIAIVAASLDTLGGHAVQARLLLERLAAEGHAVRFVPIDPRLPRALRWLRRLPYLRTVANQLLFLPSLRRLARADVVHVFSASYWSFLLAPVPAMLAGRLLGKRVVLNYHSGEAEDHLAGWGRLVHPWLRLAHEIVVPSEYLQAVFARFGYRTRVVHNVVDLSQFRAHDRVPLRPRLVSTRNLEPHYDVGTIVEAFAHVRAHYPEASLTIAGSGSEGARLRQLAAAVAPGGVRFVGRVEPPVMPGLLAEADIFVNASVVDNQPLSVLEAFAAGLPVASTPTGGLAWMVRDGETGLVVPPRDPDALAKAVIALLEDPEGARRMARAARADVEAYTWPRVRDRWLAAYRGESA